MPQAQLVSTNDQSQSPGGQNGYQIAGSTAQPVGFFGSAPIVQPTDNSQAILTRGLPAGVIATYNSTQSPTSVTTNTTAEKLLTVQSGTGGQMLLATGDLLFANKPTSQAGLTVGNVRVSSGNTIGITFGNATASNITPTASEVYSVVAIRGMGNLSATLSPAVVAANTTAEQQFKVTGLPAGQLVQVMKPTSQAGLDVVGVRVVSNNLLGITFANFTAAAITPTASESYTILPLPGLDALNNEIMYGFNVGTVGAIGAGVVVSGGSTSLTGLLATDMVTGIFDPTAQANATNAAFPVKGVPTAGVLTLYFAGIGSGATPTASEVYGIATKRLNPAAPLINYTQSLTSVSVAANTSAEQTYTVTGLVAASPVWVNPQFALPAGLGISGVRVSSANTLAINWVNLTAAAITPPVGSFVIGNFQVPYPAAGNVVYQAVSQAESMLGNLTNAERLAMVNLGLMAGA